MPETYKDIAPRAHAEVEQLRQENERLRSLLREITSFIECDPPDLRARRKEWQAERDALVARSRSCVGEQEHEGS